jgi:hypothetical protein
MKRYYSSFRQFYPFYLSEHTHPMCRRLHFTGSLLAIGFAVGAILAHNFWWLVAAVLAGYGCAWAGHFFFERNRPATFTYPVYSFIGDWAMFRDMLTGRIRW